MPKTTVFHPRLEPINATKIWKNWSGYLVAPSYQHSVISEYYAIRNSVALLDTSPLFKYQITGRDAEKFLQLAMARDIRNCKIGEAQYTTWCNEDGFVLQDGVVIHVAESEFWLTAAEPSLRWFRSLAQRFGLTKVQIEDVSSQFGILALQGPHAHNVIRQLTDNATSLKYFTACHATINGKPVLVSRTGYTGDLGYELWIRAEDAGEIWDALIKAGSGYNITPIGTTALKMSRVEAGLLLMGVDFHSARHAWVDEQRETPLELGWDWMFRQLADDDRDFVGRSAIEAAIHARSSRWKTVGLAIDWSHYKKVHLEAGISPAMHELYRETTMSLYRRGKIQFDYAGYASSFLFSSILKRPIAIAKVPLDLAKPGSELEIEIPVIRKPVNVLARVERLPFFNPPRKTANMLEGNNQ